MSLKSKLMGRVNKVMPAIKSRYYAYKRKRISNAIVSGKSEPYRLHLGCGLNRFENWLNIDICNVSGVTDIVWDLQHGIPLPDSTCSFIYNEHFLEHLSVKEALTLLRECYRVLCPGGVLRIAMPSLEEVVDIYVNDSWRTQDFIKSETFKCVKSRAELINISFYWWEHKWLYDREELHRRLNEAGFSKISDNGWGESSFSDLRNLESRKESTLICEATK